MLHVPNMSVATDLRDFKADLAARLILESGL